MELKLTFNSNGRVELPLNYNHILQGIIYSALAENKELAIEVHDTGYEYLGRTFKPFTFSPLHGKYVVTGKRICFIDRLEWVIRSADARMINLLGELFLQKGICFGKETIKNVEVRIGLIVFQDKEILIKMKAPICTYSTDNDTKQTYFYTPEQIGFYEITKQNAAKRYKAFFGDDTPSELVMRPIRVTRKDKIVTDYKGTMLSGWKGEYYLQGDPKLLTFLYNTGLGSKNAQGFGMFDVIAEGEAARRIVTEKYAE